MGRSTITRRTPPRLTADKGEPERLDLGHLVLPKGTLVEARTVGGDTVVGTLVAVDFKDGVPHTATLWVTEHRRSGDLRGARHVYADTVKEVS